MITGQNVFRHGLHRYFRRGLILGLVAVAVLISVSGCAGPSNVIEEDPKEGRVGSISAHPSFVTRQELNTVLAEGSPQPATINETIVSMVLPHHLTAGKLIVDAAGLLAEQQPERMIVVGPNHFNKGNKIITGFYAWQTPEGILKTDETVARHLVDSGIATRDEGVLAKEHSIGALVPVLYHFVPNAKIVPVVLHHDVSLHEVDALLAALADYIDDKTVVISSVDFSHYLTRAEAQAKDIETLRLMRNFDYTTLYRLGNDYLDSPASLTTALRLAEKRGIREFTVLGNTNSGIILQNDYIETTSYFTMVFTKVE